jgi:MFS family permease
VTDSAGRRPGAAAEGLLGLEPTEQRTVVGLAAIYFARMLGLFLMLPVLALYSRGLPGTTPLLTGLALGAYGLTQAVLQIPFGRLSDHLGRRPVIAAGLLLYALGSLLGALAGSIGTVIAARMVQGAGAVSGPVMALLADLTRVERRTRAMAAIGMSIGAAFVLSLVGAPLLDAAIGVPGIFLVMATLALVCLACLYGLVPEPPARRPGTGSSLAAAFTSSLMPHYLGILVLNGVLSATFVAVPFALKDLHGIPLGEHWKTYLGVFVASVLPTIPLIVWSERSGRPDRVLGAGIVLLLLALVAIGVSLPHYWALWAALAIFFTAFNYLEARLPARLSQVVPPELRGAALSVFATAQFLGSFAGAISAGWISGGPLGLGGVLGAAALVTLVWAVVHGARRA